MACCCSRFPRLPPLYFSDIQVWLRSRRGPMLRPFALLLVCLVLPVRALTPDPGGGELRYPWGLAFPPDGGYLVGEAPWAPAAHRCGRQPPCGLRPAALAATGQGGLCSIPPLDGDGWLYLSYSEPGTEAPAPPWPGP